MFIEDNKPSRNPLPISPCSASVIPSAMLLSFDETFSDRSAAPFELCLLRGASGFSRLLRGRSPSDGLDLGPLFLLPSRLSLLRGRSSRPPERRERFGRGPAGRTRARTRASPRIRPNRPAFG